MQPITLPLCACARGNYRWWFLLIGLFTLLDDKEFSLNPNKPLSRWIQDHEDEASCFGRKLVTSLLFSKRKVPQSASRENVGNIISHSVLFWDLPWRLAIIFTVKYQSGILPNFLSVRWSLNVCVQELIRLLLPILIYTSTTHINAFRYAHGYVPRLLESSLSLSTL